MKKLTILATLMLLIPFVTNAETVIKIGAISNYGKVEELKFALPSVEFKIEHSLYKGLSIGMGMRKETTWLYSGYYFSLYPTYKMKLSKNRFIAASLGTEYGLASSEYDYYSTTYDESGNLTAHKWIYLIQNASVPGDKLKKDAIGVIYPFLAISYGGEISKRLFVEAGFKMQASKFGIKSCKFEPSGLSYDIRDDKKLIIVSGVFIQIGYKLF